MRLQKLLAHAGICSRRKAEKHIKNGLVRVNGKIETRMGLKIDPEKDRIEFDNRLIVYNDKPDHVYIALNKPTGYITSCSHKNRKIVLDLIDIDRRIFPVGRLDKDSTGLLLLTDDGELHNRLSHPSFDHEKEYEVTTLRPISDLSIKKMTYGMTIDNIKLRRARIKKISENRFRIILKQGINRQIRKMVAKTGNKVQTLKRTRMANIRLGNLKSGKWRYLNPKEIQSLIQ